MEAFLECGIIEHGAVRVRCEHCGYDRLVAFSCKSRS
ncbi:MAG: transposase zinc-binding domain-containing protein, partial [Deltaproteobacteria bacterium]|nr:transposase zinc-binding domain-containing protein [Deltaproteobacteria bacterium]